MPLLPHVPVFDQMMDKIKATHIINCAQSECVPIENLHPTRRYLALDAEDKPTYPILAVVWEVYGPICNESGSVQTMLTRHARQGSVQEMSYRWAVQWGLGHATATTATARSPTTATPMTNQLNDDTITTYYHESATSTDVAQQQLAPNYHYCTFHHHHPC